MGIFQLGKSYKFLVSDSPKLFYRLGKSKSFRNWGGRHGELSLIFAYLGVKEIICSDVNEENLHKAKKLHKNYIKDMKTQIKYEVINALKIPYKEYLTIVAFKSVLGGVSRNGHDELKYQMINEIYKSLSLWWLSFICGKFRRSIFS